MKQVTMRFKDKQFDVQYDAAKVAVEALMARIKQEGFEPSVKSNKPVK